MKLEVRAIFRSPHPPLANVGKNALRTINEWHSTIVVIISISHIYVRGLLTSSRRRTSRVVASYAEYIEPTEYFTTRELYVHADRLQESRVPRPPHHTRPCLPLQTQEHTVISDVLLPLDGG